MLEPCASHAVWLAFCCVFIPSRASKESQFKGSQFEGCNSKGCDVFFVFSGRAFSAHHTAKDGSLRPSFLPDVTVWNIGNWKPPHTSETKHVLFIFLLSSGITSCCLGRTVVYAPTLFHGHSLCSHKIRFNCHVRNVMSFVFSRFATASCKRAWRQSMHSRRKGPSDGSVCDTEGVKTYFTAMC